jgi:hypothetical protein
MSHKCQAKWHLFNFRQGFAIALAGLEFVILLPQPLGAEISHYAWSFVSTDKVYTTV